MVRYIDTDKLLKSAVSKFKCVPLVGVLSYRNGEECFDGLSFEEFINEHPTADVAPRSEVAREIFAEIEANINALEYNARTPRKTVSVDELKAQMDWVLREVIPGTLAKIKQKYTEE